MGWTKTRFPAWNPNTPNLSTKNTLANPHEKWFLNPNTPKPQKRKVRNQNRRWRWKFIRRWNFQTKNSIARNSPTKSCWNPQWKQRRRPGRTTWKWYWVRRKPRLRNAKLNFPNFTPNPQIHQKWSKRNYQNSTFGTTQTSRARRSSAETLTASQRRNLLKSNRGAGRRYLVKLSEANSERNAGWFRPWEWLRIWTRLMEGTRDEEITRWPWWKTRMREKSERDRGMMKHDWKIMRRR